MKKIAKNGIEKHYFEGRNYTIKECTAIALTAGNTERQDALYVSTIVGGEKFEWVVFGWSLPKNAEDLVAMFDDPHAWDSDWETLETVRFKSIKDARLHAMLTQRQVAELLGIPLRTIENWEGGKNTPPPYVERLIINELARIAAGKY